MCARHSATRRRFLNKIKQCRRVATRGGLRWMPPRVILLVWREPPPTSHRQMRRALPRERERRSESADRLTNSPASCVASPATVISMRRLRQNNPAGKSPKVCRAPSEKIFRLTRRANQRYQLAPSHPMRGAGRDRHERAVRCGGRGGALDETRRPADGEVVWSWRPGAGAKFLRNYPRKRRWQQSRSPRRARSKP